MQKNILKLALLLSIIAGISLGFIYQDQLNATALQHWLENSGNAAPVVFVLTYIIGTIFFIPGSVLTLLGGALFGPLLGTFYSLSAATIGAMLSFLIARFLAADWVKKKSGGYLKQLLTGVENEGWHFVAFTRLVPIFPFNLLNYAFGLTKISFSQYSLATYICMFPGALAYTYLGYIGKEAATGGQDIIQKAMLALTLLAIVAFIPRIINRFRQGPMIDIQDLKLRMQTEPDILILDVRSPQDYVGEQGHIAASTLLPVEELEQHLVELEGYKNKTIITICRTDRKSAKAAKILQKNGFSNVLIAKMGMTDWNKYGYPVEF